MRDAKLLQIYEGTSQIQHMVIAKQTLKSGESTALSRALFVLITSLSVGCALAPAVLNHEATTRGGDAAQHFDHSPQPGERAICPVSGETFVVSTDTRIIQHNGRFFAFCCDDCAMDFTANPEKYDR